MTTKKLTVNQAQALVFQLSGAFNSQSGECVLKGLKNEPGVKIGTVLKLNRLTKALTSHVEDIKALITEDATEEKLKEAYGEQEFSFELVSLEEVEQIVPEALNGIVPDYTDLIEFICFPS